MAEEAEMGGEHQPYRCRDCGEGMVRQTKAPYTVREGDEEYLLHAVDQLKCDRCGAISFTLDQLDELDDRAACAYRTVKNLVLPDGIREMRKRLDLTQADLERILRVADKSVARWEAGVVHQNRGIDGLLRLYLSVARRAPELLVGFDKEQLITFLQQLPEIIPSLLAEPRQEAPGRVLPAEMSSQRAPKHVEQSYSVSTNKAPGMVAGNVSLASAA
jgi:putative zinc finger/helix-turn-helix YgiT family protein